MAQLTIQQTLQLAIRQHQAGQLSQAEAAYRQILNRQPKCADALHLLGLIDHQRGQHQAAAELIHRAISLRPSWPEALYHLGVALFALGQTEDAITAYRQATAINPHFAEALNSLGHALQQTKRSVDAADAYRQAILAKPNYADAHNNLGNALRDMGQLDLAIAAYRKAIQIRPGYPQAFNNLAAVLQQTGELEAAIASYQQAIALKPDYAAACNNLGIALREAGRVAEAIDSHQRALALQPDWAEAHNSLGNALILQGQIDPAITAYRTAANLKPAFADAHYNLGKTLFDAGEVDAALKSFEQAVALQPQNSSFASALLFAMHYHADRKPEVIADAHFDWNRQHAQAIERLNQPQRQADHDRLRIGYVSPDFRNHPVGRFMLPVLEHHDHREFEIFCFSDVGKPDAMTARLRSHADHWRDTSKLEHHQLACHVRDDQIDILVDLTGHATGSRLLMFARKPAPVQVSYLGYPGTTGVAAIDYRLTDTLADPAGLTEHYHCETLCRLPNTNWCFAEHEPSPPILPAPMIKNGHITFGSFNNFAKVTDTMLRTWAKILLDVPASRLLLKAAAFASELATGRARRTLTEHGIESDRVTLIGPQLDHFTHLSTCNAVDIALDTFPYHGTTTTCDALWMGVPVVTLAGQSHASRVGVSLLSNLGLTAIIATSIDDYVRVAVDWARDRDRLNQLRLTLRERMMQSPLMDAPRLARNLESAYRRMWKNRQDCNDRKNQDPD